MYYVILPDKVFQKPKTAVFCLNSSMVMRLVFWYFIGGSCRLDYIKDRFLDYLLVVKVGLDTFLKKFYSWYIESYIHLIIDFRKHLVKFINTIYEYEKSGQSWRLTALCNTLYEIVKMEFIFRFSWYINYIFLVIYMLVK